MEETNLTQWETFLTSQGIPFTVTSSHVKPTSNCKTIQVQSIHVGVTKDYDEEWNTPGYRKYFSGDPSGSSETALDIDFDTDGKFLRFDPFVDEAPVRVADLKHTEDTRS